MVYFDHQVVIVDFLALKRVTRSTRDGIGVRRSSTRYEVRDSAMLMALVIGRVRIFGIVEACVSVDDETKGVVKSSFKSVVAKVCALDFLLEQAGARTTATVNKIATA
jgi:hypothetical protein